MSQQKNAEKKRVFGIRLRTRCEKLSIQQNELAQHVGVKPSAIGGWMRGEYLPTGKNMRKLTERLGVSAEWLLGKETAADDAPTLPKLHEPQEQRRKFFSSIIYGRKGEGKRLLLEKVSEHTGLAMWMLHDKTETDLNELISKAAIEGQTHIARELLDYLDARRAATSSEQDVADAVASIPDAERAADRGRGSPPKPGAAAPSAGKSRPSADALPESREPHGPEEPAPKKL